MPKKVIIIGAGPAGLAAGLELLKNNYKVVIIDRLNKVGGMSRTEKLDGHHFDIGPHRFFSKSDEVNKLWQGLLGEDFLANPRLTRMYYKRKYFLYPVELKDVLKNLGLFEGFLIGMSLIKVRIKGLFRGIKDNSFADWVTNRFGDRLFNHFFKSYTEKLWGISTKEIDAGWAAQRLKDISLLRVIKNFIFPDKKKKIKSWIKEFNYPKHGAGQMYGKMAEEIKRLGGEIILESEVVDVKVGNGEVDSFVIKNKDGNEKIMQADYYISAAPINKLISLMGDNVPVEVRESAGKLKFRSTLIVALLVNKSDVFPDNWLYIHEPEVDILRITKFKNFSESLMKNDHQSVLGIEYSTWEGDGLWNLDEEEMINQAKSDLAKIKLVNLEDVALGRVIKVADAYPLYAFNHSEYLGRVFDYLKGLNNFQTIGRSGLFRYNNMDHSILTGLAAARNVMGEKHDLLSINADEDYHEEEGK